MTVAVIDTGVAPVPGLDGAGKVVNGPDLSFEGQVVGTRYLDGYGHGTHMAAIIAGRDATGGEGEEDGEEDGEEGSQNSTIPFRGVAPDARILNVKVASADGGTDVSQVVAAVDWVVQHRKDNGMNVRVINLSYGTRSLQPYELDPLAHAVENAWRHGIVVVVAAGNDGLGATSLTMPAVDPYVIAVGAVDHRGTPDRFDDVVASFTNGGNSNRRPDLLAPGKSVVSARVPLSHADRAHPEGLVVGDAKKRFFRGSGTSQAAAVVSGAVALILQDKPKLTPDRVKYLLTRTAVPLVENPHPAMGAGVLDIERAIDVAVGQIPTAAQTWPVSTGLGTLEGSRGGSHVVDPVNGAVLAGEVDALGAPWTREAGPRRRPRDKHGQAGTGTPGPGVAADGAPGHGQAMPGPRGPGAATRGPVSPGRRVPGRPTTGTRVAGPETTGAPVPGRRPRGWPAAGRATTGPPSPRGERGRVRSGDSCGPRGKRPGEGAGS